MHKRTTPNRKRRKAMMILIICSTEHGGDDLDVEELLHNIQLEELFENRKRGFDNLEMMEKASKELLYDESKGCDKECIVLQMALDLLTLKTRNGLSDTSFN
jgi:hypothetical protein